MRAQFQEDPPHNSGPEIAAEIAAFREVRDASIIQYLPAGAQGIGGMTDIDMSLGFDMWLLLIVIPPF